MTIDRPIIASVWATAALLLCSGCAMHVHMGERHYHGVAQGPAAGNAAQALVDHILDEERDGAE